MTECILASLFTVEYVIAGRSDRETGQLVTLRKRAIVSRMRADPDRVSSSLKWVVGGKLLTVAFAAGCSVVEDRGFSHW